MRFTSMTYNLMRVFEEISKTQDPEQVCPSDKNMPRHLKKRIKLQKNRLLC